MNRPTSLLIQEGSLRSYFPNSQIKRKDDSEIDWIGKIKPTPLSATYMLRIHYKRGDSVKVYVVNPKPLRLFPGEKRLPHVYNQAEQRLCLYYPKNKEWDASKLYVHTLIPWACEWLMHYEIWVCTGKWEGGGIEHNFDI